MDRLIWSQVDFDHKPLSVEQRVKARKAKGKKPPRHETTYRGMRRNLRVGDQRKNPSSVGKGYLGPIKLNRSKHWKPADNYYDARDLSQSNRPVV